MPKIAIIGGGPAGSSVAALLAKFNYEVSVYEAEAFPRPHIGESLLPATLINLMMIGSYNKVAEAGFTKKNGATMSWGQSSELWSWYFRETNQHTDFAFQVNREEFDQILLEHATDCGAVVQQPRHVEKVIFEEDRAVALQVDDEVVEADFIVDATGQQSLIANQQGLKQWDDDFQNSAIYRYYEGGNHLSGDASGNILIESCQNGWFWKIPLKDDVSGVGLVTDSKSIRELREMEGGDSYARYFDEALETTQYINELLDGAQVVGKTQITRDWSYCSQRFIGSSHCLIGDAACFIDPLFSTGVHLAIFSALNAACYINTLFTRQEIANLAAAEFENSYRVQYNRFRDLVRLFYGSNYSVDSYFWHARQITGESNYLPREAFIRGVSGEAPQGYERTTLSHGKLPQTFTTAVSAMESGRAEKSAIWDKHITRDTEFRFSEGVSLEEGAVLNIQSLCYEQTTTIRRPNLDDLPIHAALALSLGGLKKNLSFSQIEKQISLGSTFPNSPDFSSLFDNDWRILYIDGVLELI